MRKIFSVIVDVLPWIIPIAVVAVLSGCAGNAEGGWGGLSRGYSAQIDTPFVDFTGVATTYKHATEKPLQSEVEGRGFLPDQIDMVSTMESKPDGSFTMTGPAVYLRELTRLCTVAPASPLCGGNPPPGLFAELAPAE